MKKFSPKPIGGLTLDTPLPTPLVLSEQSVRERHRGHGKQADEKAKITA